MNSLLPLLLSLDGDKEEKEDKEKMKIIESLYLSLLQITFSPNYVKSYKYDGDLNNLHQDCNKLHSIVDFIRQNMV
jgi:hypothetical protein